MKKNTKSSITLPPRELELVEELKKKMGAKSNVGVIRLGLLALKESIDRKSLRASYAAAASVSRESSEELIGELDSDAGEGI